MSNKCVSHFRYDSSYRMVKTSLIFAGENIPIVKIATPLPSMSYLYLKYL